jgi:MFS family permease
MMVICAAQFVLQLDFSIVNVALPTIQHELGMAPADLQWIVTGYALTFGSLLLVGGRLAGYVYIISLYLQKVQGFSPVETGPALVPSTLTVVVTSTFVTRRLVARLDLKWVLLAGLACLAGGQLWLGQISAGASYPARRNDWLSSGWICAVGSVSPFARG